MAEVVFAGVGRDGRRLAAVLAEAWRRLIGGAARAAADAGDVAGDDVIWACGLAEEDVRRLRDLTGGRGRCALVGADPKFPFPEALRWRARERLGDMTIVETPPLATAMLATAHDGDASPLEETLLRLRNWETPSPPSATAETVELAGDDAVAEEAAAVAEAEELAEEGVGDDALEEGAAIVADADEIGEEATATDAETVELAGDDAAVEEAAAVAEAEELAEEGVGDDALEEGAAVVADADEIGEAAAVASAAADDSPPRPRIDLARLSALFDMPLTEIYEKEAQRRAETDGAPSPRPLAEGDAGLAYQRAREFVGAATADEDKFFGWICLLLLCDRFRREGRPAAAVYADVVAFLPQDSARFYPLTLTATALDLEDRAAVDADGAREELAALWRRLPTQPFFRSPLAAKYQALCRAVVLRATLGAGGGRWDVTQTQTAFGDVAAQLAPAEVAALGAEALVAVGRARQDLEGLM